MNCPPDRKARLWCVLWLLVAPMGWGQNQWTDEIDGVRFDSDYDNGSLGPVTLQGDGDFVAALYEEVGELGARRYWFRFRLSGLAGRVVRLTLEHDENPRPFVRSGDGAWRRMTAEEAPDLHTLVVTLGGDGEGEGIEVAFFEPLGVTETETAIADLVARMPQFVSSRSFGETDEGRSLSMLTITDPMVPEIEKRRVWVHSRAHAAEVTGTHSLLGFVEQLLDDSVTARELRRRLIVHVVPILNLDGVHRGYTRWDAEGRDPESQWCAIDSPAVQAVKEEVDLLMRDPVPVTVALNLHSTKGVYADSFFFKHLAPSVSPAFEIIQQRYIDALASETALFENRSAESSQLHACRFIESYLWTGWGESVMALTHEGHYHRRLPDQAWITGQDYRNLGRAMARALSGYYEFSLPAVLTWDAWLAEHFDPLERRFASLAGPAADADRDGVANLLEYGMGTDPREARSRPQPPEWQDNESRLSWVRMAAASEVAWQVERSLDLESWQQTQPVSWTITGSDGGQQERVQLGFASSEGAAFYRVLAVLDKDR